jgi:hypothetical protein
MLDELIKIYAEGLKGDAEVIPEVKVAVHPDHVGNMFFVL